nr:Uncharacterised protein [Streptococcus thermophilus]
MLSGIGVDDLAGFDRGAFIAAGLSPARVTELNLVHSAYYGPTRSSLLAVAQRTAVNAAREGAVGVDKLAQIARTIRHVASDTERAAYRATLIDAATIASCSALARYAKSVVPPREANPLKQATFGASVKGLRTAVITACEHVMATLEAALRAGINRDLPAALQMAEAFEDLMRSGAGVPAAAPRPTIVVPAPELARILAGDGDDILLGLTDGTTITGAEFLRQYFQNPDFGLEAALFHPTAGPLKHYRDRRFASEKQRTLAKITQPICANPDCRMPADLCQDHHVNPWKNGGPTNMDNLAIVCEYHNRVNGDDGHIRKRGRNEIRHGRPVCLSPTGYPRTNTRHPYGAMDKLFGTANRAAPT